MSSRGTEYDVFVTGENFDFKFAAWSYRHVCDFQDSIFAEENMSPHQRETSTYKHRDGPAIHDVISCEIGSTDAILGKGNAAYHSRSILTCAGQWAPIDNNCYRESPSVDALLVTSNDPRPHLALPLTRIPSLNP